jgi:putative ATP-binding cassette transporter
VIQEKLEANFRFRLMRIIERREEIAKLHGELFEKRSLNDSFLEISKNFYNILKRQMYLTTVQSFCINVEQLIPLVIAGPQYFAGSLTFGALMQIKSMFQRVATSMSVLALSFSSIAGWLASMRRLTIFHQQINLDRRQRDQFEKKGNNIVIKDLQIYSPRGSKIISIPDLQVNPGQRIMLFGRSGIGKSSLIRVLSGIYKFYEGDIQIPTEEILIIPQKPYMPISKLSDCLCYPSQEVDHKSLVHYMKLCHLENLIGDLDKIDNWQNILSLGEQQKISFIRVLLHRPKWLVLDEPISSLNEEIANHLIDVLVKDLPNTAMIIVSHKDDGKKHMHHIISL